MSLEDVSDMLACQAVASSQSSIDFRLSIPFPALVRPFAPLRFAYLCTECSNSQYTTASLPTSTSSARHQAQNIALSTRQRLPSAATRQAVDSLSLSCVFSVMVGCRCLREVGDSSPSRARTSC